MAFLDLLKQLLRVSDSSDEPQSAEVQRGIELREILNENPNDVGAFQELAELVNSAAGPREVEDPLTAEQGQTDTYAVANLTMWSLSEELSGRPNAWYPLIELARLSVDSDLEGATRRLNTAAQRDETGRALAEGVKVLRGAGQADAAYSLGVGHWDPANHKFAAGEQIILAALDARRPDQATIHLDRVRAVAKPGQHDDRMTFLEESIASVEAEEDARLRQREN